MNAQVWKAMFILMVFTLGTSMVSPLLPLYQEEFHLSKGGTVLIFAVYTLAVVPAMLLFGQLSDQVGRKRVIWLAMVLGILGSALLGSSHSANVLYLGRIVQGLAIGAFLGTCTAYVVDLADAGSKLIAAVLAGVSFRVGFGLGPGLAGVMAQYFPYPLNLTFFIHIVLMVLGTVVLFSIPETIISRHFRGISVNFGIPASQKRPFIFFVLPSAFILTVLDSSVLSLSPLFITDILGNSNLAVMGLVSFLVLAAGGVSQIPAAYIQPKRSIILGIIIGVASLYLFFVSAWSQNVYLIVVAAALIGAANGLIMKGGVTMCSLMVPPEERGRLLSTYYTCCYTGILVPLGIGYLANHIGLFAAMVALTFALTVLVGILSLGTSRLLIYRHEGFDG
ncbi:MAG: MFS transporter [Thermincolia bacterium]